MSIETRVDALATAIGAELKNTNTRQGNLSELQTNSQESLVAAINEALANAGVKIVDGSVAAGSTWSSTKIAAAIADGVAALVGTAGATLDTVQELAAAFENNPDVLAEIRALVVTNKEAHEANALALSTLATAVGNTDKDFAATFNAALTA